MTMRIKGPAGIGSGSRGSVMPGGTSGLLKYWPRPFLKQMNFKTFFFFRPVGGSGAQKGPKSALYTSQLSKLDKDSLLTSQFGNTNNLNTLVSKSIKQLTSQLALLTSQTFNRLVNWLSLVN